MSKEQDRFLRNNAWEFLLEQGIKALPVDPFSIINKNGWLLYTYFRLSDRIGKTVEEIKRKYNSDGFVFWSATEDNYVICYNSELPIPVVRWTLVHEISHIVLGHISKTAPILDRVRVKDRTLFEKEAQGWTRRVICPSIVLHNCKAFDVDSIMRLCGITREAALYRSEYMQVLEARGMYRTDPCEIKVEKQFAPFVLSYLRQGLDMEIAAELTPIVAA